MIFYNESNHGYYFIIKELAKEFEEINCLGENTAKYKTSSVPIKKEVKGINKNGEQIRKTISCKLLFIESAIFMVCSLSNLVAETIYNINCKYGHNNKKCETFVIKFKDCKRCLEYKNVKDHLIPYECLCCN